MIKTPIKEGIMCGEPVILDADGQLVNTRDVVAVVNRAFEFAATNEMVQALRTRKEMYRDEILYVADHIEELEAKLDMASRVAAERNHTLMKEMKVTLRQEYQIKQLQNELIKLKGTQNHV